MEQASFTGVLRTIFIALVAWWVVKAILRIATAVKRPMADEHRATGEMRIEHIDPEKPASRTPEASKIDDVDFEEIQ